MKTPVSAASVRSHGFRKLGRFPAKDFRAYAAALLLGALATGLNLLLAPFMAPNVFPPYYAAIMLAAWYGGSRPALLALILSSLSLVYFFLPPVDSFTFHNLNTMGRLLGFLLGGIMIAWLTGRLRDALRHAERARQDQAFLAQASELLSEALDYRETLSRLARLSVPRIGDFCVVDVFDEETGQVERLAIAHENPVLEEKAKRFGQRYPLRLDTMQGAAKVIRTGRAEFVPQIPDELLAQATHSEEQLDALREFDLHSYMSLPLTARGRILGAISFAATAAWGRVFDGTDLAVATDLARRAALALDNARLLQESRAVRQRLENQLNFTQALTDSLGEGVCAVNRQGEITFMNPAAERMLGYAKEALLGRPAHRILHQWRHDAAFHPEDQPLSAVIESGETMHSADDVFVRQDGALLSVDYTSSPIRMGEDIVGRVLAFQDITERKQAEAVLLGQKELLEMVARGMPLQGILDAVNRFVELNAEGALCSILLLDEDEQHLRCASASSFPRAYSQAVDGMEVGPANGSCGTAAFWKAPVFVSDIAADPLWEKFRELALRHGLRACWSTPILSSEGKVLGTFAMYFRAVREVTPHDLQLIEMSAHLAAIAIEHQRAQERLMEKEAQYRRIVETANEGIWILDRDARTRYVNDRLLGMFGYARDEFENKAIFEFVAAGQRAQAEAFLQAQKAGGGQAFDFEFQRKDGSPLCALVTVSPMFGREGIFQGVLYMLTDITDRKQAEMELRRSEERYRSLVEATSEVIWSTDAAGDVVGDLPQWRELTGQSLEEVQGQGWSNALHPEDRERAMAIWRRSVAQRVMYQTEYRIRCRDGEYLHVVARGVPVLELDGNVREWVCVCIDISERKKAEEEIRKLNAELEKRVEERTAELMAANKELESFSYSVSHDLRAPLRAINGFSLALMEDHGDKLDAEGRRHLERVRTASQHMSELIDALLNLSRISRSELRHVSVDLSQLAELIAGELQKSETGRRVELRIEAQVRVKGDPNLLRIMLDNLLGNAWKFTRQREIARIEFGLLRQNGERIYFVRDNGAGFDMQYADKLFGAFQRLHRPAEFEGTGIGLATVQRIVHRHGGRIWAQAQPDQGAAFFFTL